MQITEEFTIKANREARIFELAEKGLQALRMRAFQQDGKTLWTISYEIASPAPGPELAPVDLLGE